MTGAPPPERRRLVSLDVFRGATIAAMILVNNPGDWGHVYRQLDHAEWNGWTTTDLIFPFFLFITGVSMSLSRSGASDRPKSRTHLKALKRSAILFALGLFLNGFPFFQLENLRIMGVLQRIAVCYLAASVVTIECGWGAQAAWAVGLLFVYWAAMTWYPVPGVGPGVWEKGRNFSAYVDGLVLQGHMWAQTKTWDPEGTVSTLPAVSTTLFGALTGRWLVESRSSEGRKAAALALAGCAGMAIGAVWSLVLPINKNLWTSSYSVFMAGFALVILGGCYYLIEARNLRGWTLPFDVFGKNSILVFVLSGVLGRTIIYWKISSLGRAKAVKTILYNEIFASRLSPYRASVAYAVCFLLLLYLPMWALYKKKIFVKI
ncbi:MAG: acyltransferase family protein [Elusimicrobiota bacterium]